MTRNIGFAGEIPGQKQIILSGSTERQLRSAVSRYHGILETVKDVGFDTIQVEARRDVLAAVHGERGQTSTQESTSDKMPDPQLSPDVTFTQIGTNGQETNQAASVNGSNSSVSEAPQTSADAPDGRGSPSVSARKTTSHKSLLPGSGDSAYGRNNNSK